MEEQVEGTSSMGAPYRLRTGDAFASTLSSMRKPFSATDERRFVQLISQRLASGG
jgi:hypothetical protein